MTLDPAHDMPAVLREYAKQVGAGPGWTFLTGKAADVEARRWSSLPSLGNPERIAASVLRGMYFALCVILLSK